MSHRVLVTVQVALPDYEVLTGVEYRTGELDVPEVSRTLRHALTAGLTFEVPVDGAHPWIHQTTHLGITRRLVHDLRVFDLGDRIRFLNPAISIHTVFKQVYAHYFLRREDTELDLSDTPNRRCRMGELMAKHDDTESIDKVLIFSTKQVLTPFPGQKKAVYRDKEARERERG